MANPENTMNGNNVYLLTQINPETTNGLVMQLTQWVNALPIAKKTVNKHTKIYTPYEVIPDNIPVLNVWINSCGGSFLQTAALLNMFHIASARGAIVQTYNIGRAASCASMIAVSGTKGYRYMGQDNFNLIHYGNTRIEINHPEEIVFKFKDFDKHLNDMYNIYQTNTKLTKEQINNYLKTEDEGQLFADDCLTYGVCDWVITNDGRFVNNVAELKTKQR